MRNRSPRAVEALLLTAVLLFVSCGLWLTYAGKTASVPYPNQAVNINTAGAETLASVLECPYSAAQALAAARAARGGFPSLAAARRAARAAHEAVSVSDPRLVVRGPGDVLRAVLIGWLLYALSLLAAHALVRRWAAGADPFPLPLTALLSGLGLMMALSVQDPYRDTLVFSAQARGVALWGLAALAVPLLPAFGRLNLRRYSYLYALAGVGLLALLRVAGHGPGGVRITVLGFEPVEVIKVLLALFAAAFLAGRQGLGAGSATPDAPPISLRPADLLPMAGLYGFALLLFAVVRDLGPAVLLLGLLMGLLYVTTQRAAYPLLGAAALAVAAVIGYALHFGFFRTRVVMWLHPWGNSDPHGAQLGQGLWGLATGGYAGSGLGLGSVGVMPRAGSDLVFASLGEQLGLVGTLATLCLYVLLLARGLRIARRAGTEFDRLLATGLTVLLTLQALLITGGVTGLIPLTGITLPFVSYGTSSLVSDFFCIGLLLHISGKRLPEGVADVPTPGWTRAARRVALACGVFLLGGVGVGRLMLVQGAQNDAVATRPLRTPDADGVARAHLNPRLLLYAQSIPRGRILDRNGLTLARDARPGEAGGVGFLCPDGRARVYAGGPACGHLLLAAEGPRTDDNPLGRNVALRGYDTLASLLPLYRARWMPLAHRPQGRDVTLTVDAHLQEAALNALVKYAGRIPDRRTGQPGHRGAAVLLDAGTGDVLALVSLPALDPAHLTGAQWARLHTSADPDHPLLNRALAGLYPPGSVFKTVTAAAALRAGLDGTLVTCPHTEHNITWRIGEKHYARARITDEEGFVPHGRTDLAKALRVSCNIYFAHLGLALGPDALLTTARDGFGLSHMPAAAKLGEDLPDCAYGQGAVTVTPLEMARVAQAVAHGGVLLPVRFARGAGGAGHSSAPLTPAQAARLAGMLAAVTRPGGTASGVFDTLSAPVAGKTGSAQNGQGDGRTHSWFAGFAPAQSPTLAFACVVENGGFGRDAAAPVCRDLLRAAL